ncbi:MAG TPA: thioredoxin [Bacteroidia bacterium]|nr:thioredoxin [Bacteroidia bacterium]
MAASFRELINSGKPVLVDFFAEWCGPCKAMAPVLSEVSSRVGDSAHILKVDVDKNPAAAGSYGIRAVPTMLLFKNGNVVWKHSGTMGPDELERVIRSAM